MPGIESRTKLMVEELSVDYAQALEETAAGRPGAAIFRFDEAEDGNFTFTPGLAVRMGKLEGQRDYVHLSHGNRTVPPGYRPDVDTNAQAIDEQWRVQARRVRTGRVACLLMCEEDVDGTNMLTWRKQAIELMAQGAGEQTVEAEDVA